MSTRLSNTAKQEAQNAINQFLSAGVRFIDCPLADTEIVELWQALLDPEYVAAAEVLKAKGIDVGYSLMDDDVTFYVREEQCLHSVQFKRIDRVFLKPCPTMIRNSPQFTAEIKPGKHSRVDKKFTTSYDQLIIHLGRERFQAFRDWMLSCDTMIAEIRNAHTVVGDLFKMIKTSGQLKRMVPDLFRYIPDEQRAAFDDQKRASSYPFEWPGYPRKNVDKMLDTLMKCYLLRGSEKERNKAVDINNLGNWSETRWGASIYTEKE